MSRYPIDLLEAVGMILFGSRWQTDLARALRVTDRTVRRWATGASPISAEMWKRIDSLLADHERRLARIRTATSGATGQRAKQTVRHTDPGDLMHYAHAHSEEFADEHDLAESTSVDFLTRPVEDHRFDMITLLHGDCIERMAEVPDQSVNLILADLPYGMTQCTWDTLIPLEPLWDAYRRIITPTGAIVLTATQPFSSIVVSSNLEWFKYAWVWEKNRPTGFAHARHKPMKRHEDILVFSPGTTIQPSRSARRMTYNPQGIVEVEPKTVRNRRMSELFGPRFCHTQYERTQTGFPGSVLRFPTCTLGLHPSAKPVDLMRYLVRTYSHPGETVMDNTMGSGTTGVAAIMEGRRFIGIERGGRFFEMSWTRIMEAADVAKA